ncbi:MAG: LysE family transporter [Rhodospirillales bacterium]|nr:LysE family transporter [Rhodospirillales bacterium]
MCLLEGTFGVMLFFKAMAAGFVIAVPVGAIGAMCMRRGLQGRWMVSLLTGLGAATADTCLAAVAMFGLSLVTEYIHAHEHWLRIVGGLFLIYIGVRMVRSRQLKITEAARPQLVQMRHWRIWLSAFSTGFGLTIINPATFLAFIAVFAGLGLLPGQAEGLAQLWAIIVGVFAGSMLWWCVLTGMSFAARHKLPLGILSALNTCLGLLVVGLGVYGLLTYFDLSL